MAIAARESPTRRRPHSSLTGVRPNAHGASAPRVRSARARSASRAPRASHAAFAKSVLPPPRVARRIAPCGAASLPSSSTSAPSSAPHSPVLPTAAVTRATLSTSSLASCCAGCRRSGSC
eukprot:5883789-Prymnesium_polylepis.2